MDVALSNAIIQTATHMASARNSDAVNIAVLKKALDMQETTAAAMLGAMAQSLPQPQLATSGTLGTQLNTYA
ncbi:YjfB family protein [Comamonas granuli]|uniref:YjfB family protein n=1 Tax=Comamonas granuli TaxID=290309 RepID=UPI0005A8B8F9|nr:YjfB family protein [Comamonas granuli]